MKSYKQIVKEKLLEREKKLKKELKAVCKAKKDLEKDKPLLFAAEIHSLWADYGEKSVTVSGEKSVDSILKKACKEFKEVNKRSDVQGAPHVWAIANEVAISLPEKRWWNQYKKYGKHKG